MSVTSLVGEPPQNDHAEFAVPFRIAMIGCGPKGLYCLERLANELRATPRDVRVEVTIFEPAAYPGAGVVYDPQQPAYLRMNYSADNIDAWVGPTAQRRLGEMTLVDWLTLHYPSLASPSAYVPRRIVGHYLYDAYQRVAGELSTTETVQVFRAVAMNVKRHGAQWLVETFDRASSAIPPFDEVLITVGHEGWRNSASPNAAACQFDVDHVFPVCRQLTRQRVPCGAAVALRGFGLTAIDALLALTEGRGGRFATAGGRCTYLPSGMEPAVVYPYTRSGKAMLAKPTPEQMRLPRALPAIWAEFADRLAALRRPAGGFGFVTDLWPIVRDSAERALNLCGGQGVNQWFKRWCCSGWDAERVYGEVRESAEVAMGLRPPGPAWALGEAWRQLFPTLARQLNHDGLAPYSWAEYRAIAEDMDRIALGPPAEMCLRQLALVDHGLLDLRYLAGGTVLRKARRRRAIEIPRSREHSEIDVHINSVVPRSSQTNTRGPLRQLSRSGILTAHSSGSGYRITPAGRPINSAGRCVEGIAVIGRPTEGCVVGNDTLSRTFNHHPAAWAKSVSERLAVVSQGRA